jgi:uncharacterized phiE125 gp8 family phage protein
MAKKHLRVRATSEDEIIQIYLDAAIGWAEVFCNRSFGYNSYTLYYRNFSFEFKNPPVEAITEVAYIPAGEAAYVTIEEANYRLDEDGILPTMAFLEGFSLPSLADRSDAVKVTYEAGFTAETLERPILSGILMKLSALYDNRAEESARFATTAERILLTGKIFSL